MTIRSDHQLSPHLVKIVKRMKELFENLLFAFEELDIVEQKTSVER